MPGVCMTCMGTKTIDVKEVDLTGLLLNLKSVCPTCNGLGIDLTIQQYDHRNKVSTGNKDINNQ